MIGIIKNITNEKEYNNLSFNEEGIDYLSVVEGKLIELEPHLFSTSLIQEIKNTRNAVNTYCKKSSEEKLIKDIFNTFYNNLLILTKITKDLETISCLPEIASNEKEEILEVDTKMIGNGKDLDPTVYIFHNDLFNLNFESLLMFSHSLLDKFAVYIKKYRIFHTPNESLVFKKALNNNSRKKQMYYFSHLKSDIKKLRNANLHDSLIVKLYSEIDKIKILENIIVPSGKHKTLRNRIVHQESILGISNSIFAVYRYKNKFYKFDNFIGDTSNIKKDYPPLVECVDRILKTIVHFSLNNLNTIMNKKYNLSLNTNVTDGINWNNPLFNYENYLVKENDPNEKIKFNTFNISHNGFVLEDFYFLKKELFS